MSERDDSIGRMIDGASDGSSDYLAVCEALGIVYAADGMPLGAGPIGAVLAEIKRLQNANAKLERVRKILSQYECDDGSEAHDEESHDYDCVCCLACRVSEAIDD